MPRDLTDEQLDRVLARSRRRPRPLRGRLRNGGVLAFGGILARGRGTGAHCRTVQRLIRDQQLVVHETGEQDGRVAHARAHQHVSITVRRVSGREGDDPNYSDVCTTLPYTINSVCFKAFADCLLSEGALRAVGVCVQRVCVCISTLSPKCVMLSILIVG